MALTSLIRKARKLAGWQDAAITKHVVSEDEILHPAAAPMSTDQEAGGASTTPDGEIINENKPNKKTEEISYGERSWKSD